MPDLEKTGNINIPKYFYCSGYEVTAIYPLFLNIEIDRDKTISIFVAHSWIYKIKHA